MRYRMSHPTRPIALITGGSRGIGLSLARFLADSGYRVALTGRNPETLLAARSSLEQDAVFSVAGDASNPDDVVRAVDETVSHWGPIDLLVNNAGILGPQGSFLETDIQDMWAVQEVNIRGPLLFMKAVLPSMLERQQGTIINMGSYAAVRSIPGNPAYSASKAALAKISESVGLEIRGSGVRVFCVSPGLVETDMTRDTDLFKSVPKQYTSQPEAVCTLIQRLINEARDDAFNGRFFHVTDDLDAVLHNAETIQDGGLYRLSLNNLDGHIA